MNAAPSIDTSVPGDLQRRLKQKYLSESEAKKLLDGTSEWIAALEKKKEEAKESDPFWFYQPSTGDLTPDGHALLKEFLKPEDIPAQLDGQVHVHASKADILGVAGGNQSSKTTTGTIHDLIKACGIVPPSLEGIYPKEKMPTKDNNRIRVVCEDYTHGILNHNLPTIKKWVPRKYLIDGVWEKSWSDKHNSLTLVHPERKSICATVEYMSNQADVKTFQGPPIDRVRYDEEPRFDIYEENLLRFVTSQRLDIEFDMTPTNGLTWVHEDLFKEDRTVTGEIIEWFKLCSATNPKANLKVLYEICRKIRDYDTLKMRLLGEWISLSGLVYGAYFKRRTHVIQPEVLGLSKGTYLSCTCRHIISQPDADAMNSDHLPGCKFLDWIIFRGMDPHTVKATAAVFLALSREGLHVVDRCWQEELSTSKIKSEMKRLAFGYRLAWTRVDPSSDSDNTTLDNRNIFKELKSGDDAIPMLKKAQKYSGSIKTGVEVIRDLMDAQKLVVVDRPENQVLINAFRTLQKDSYVDEDRKGQKDAILEGKHDLHAALRYILQSHLYWWPHNSVVPTFNMPDPEAGF